MLLKSKTDTTLIEISEVDELINPFKDQVEGKIQEGQNEQPSESFSKEDLIFPSGEDLPRCWLDSDYNK